MQGQMAHLHNWIHFFEQFSCWCCYTFLNSLRTYFICQVILVYISTRLHKHSILSIPFMYHIYIHPYNKKIGGFYELFVVYICFLMKSSFSKCLGHNLSKLIASKQLKCIWLQYLYSISVTLGIRIIVEGTRFVSILYHILQRMFQYVPKITVCHKLIVILSVDLN